jgi:hypothetical protein
MVTLITSRIKNKRPDILLLQSFEQVCLKKSSWRSEKGAQLFPPIKLSGLIYTILHYLTNPILRNYKKNGAVLSFGLPYKRMLFAKTFPYFSIKSDLRVLWTYDVWEPKFKEFEWLVRKGKINLLLLSSYQATEYFQKLNLPNCKVH